MGHILQRGRKGLDQAVGQLGEEADGVHVQDSHAGGQRPSVGCDVQCCKQLIPGLDGRVSRQGLDQCGFPWKAGCKGTCCVKGPNVSPTSTAGPWATLCQTHVLWGVGVRPQLQSLCTTLERHTGGPRTHLHCHASGETRPGTSTSVHKGDCVDGVVTYVRMSVYA